MLIGNVSRLFSSLCAKAIQQNKDITLAIYDRDCKLQHKLWIDGINGNIPSIRNCKIPSIIMSADALSLSIKHEGFIIANSSKIKSLIISERIFSFDAELVNVTQLQWCYPSKNLFIIRNIAALKWCNLCVIDKAMWNLLAICCPTLESLVTACSHSHGAAMWRASNSRIMSLNVMQNLLVLVIANNISTELICPVIEACPALLHLVIDSGMTIDNTVYPPIVVSRHIVLPANIISFGISSQCAKDISVDFSNCRNIRLLNVPLLEFGSDVISISTIFRDFLRSNNENNVLIQFIQYQTRVVLCNQDRKASMIKIKNSLKTSIKDTASFTIMFENNHHLSKDNYLISTILKNLFNENTLTFIEPDNIKETFITHLNQNCINKSYVQLLKRASSTGFVKYNFQPLVIVPIRYWCG